jgi:hypothetical protein
MELKDADEEGSEMVEHFDEEVPAEADGRGEIRESESVGVVSQRSGKEVTVSELGEEGVGEKLTLRRRPRRRRPSFRR